MDVHEQLLAAIEEQDVERVKRLLEAGASPVGKTGQSQYPLSIAAATGNAQLVKALLDAGADAERYFDMPPLLEAAARGSLECVELLLENGAPVDQPDEDGGTPLMSAALAGHFEIVERLVTHGADVDAWDRADGCTALSCAASRGRTRIYEFLKPRASERNREHAAKEVEAGLEWARRLEAFHPRTGEIREAVLARDVDRVRALHREIPGDAVDEEGRHPIWYGAKVGKPDVLAIMLEAGAPVNLQDLRDGLYPLHVAVMQGNHEAARVLLDAGAEVDARDRSASTPLLAACDHDASPECVELLLEAGADPNARDARGETPLMRGCDGWSGDFTAAARLLMEAGADLDARDPRGRSAFARACGIASQIAIPDRVRRGAAAAAAGLASLGAPLEGGAQAELIIACQVGDAGKVDELIAGGVDVNRKTLGLTPLGEAARAGHRGVVERLLRAGAPPDAGQVMSAETPLADAVQTPLMDAAQQGHAEIVRLLVEAGAEIDAQCFGRTALHNAAESGGLEVVGILLEAGADPTPRTLVGETAAQVAAGEERAAIVSALEAAARRR
ncbi:MAG: ankyrin repeat domain-containing protein [Myxococcota bacterium]|nr:ankyrin repeat domain-containing protein [Myxococcota bacterium]